jgi:hypothetical protein
MTMNHTQPTGDGADGANRGTRRDFLAGVARTIGLGSLGALAVGQELKRRRLAGDPECIRPNVCADCIEFGGCPLPKAEAARRDSAS